MNQRMTGQLFFSLCLAGVVAFAAACGTPASPGGNGSPGADAGSNTPNDGGNGNDAGPGSGPNDAGPGDAGPPPTYCDGFEAQDSTTMDDVNVQTYAFGGTLKSEMCNTTIDGYADGTAITSISGILDLDTGDNGTGSPAPSIFASNCGDLGLAFTAPTATTFTPPAGALTVAAGIAGAGTSGVNIYGVVTAVYAWGIDPDTMKATTGTIYIQDATTGTAMPATKSGTEIYFSKTNEASYGTAPNVGDVVEVTNLGWSPYQGVNQFAASATTVVTHLGTSPLPNAVPITPANAGMASYVTSSGYEGMRVSVTGSFKVHGSGPSGTCPTWLQYMSTGG